MSADNWEICPRCMFRAKAMAQGEANRVGELYGQVPIEEFDEARAALKPIREEDYRTLREDYEFWIEEGEIRAVYRCRCSVCGLSGDLKASERFWNEADG